MSQPKILCVASSCTLLLSFASVAYAQVPQGSEFQVNTYTLDQQYRTSVSGLGTSGEFLVVWESRNNDGSSHGIFGQRLDQAGSPAGPEFQINSFTPGLQGRAWVADIGTSGDFVVVWRSDGQDGSAKGIFGQRFSSDATSQGSEFQVNSYTTADQSYPAVAGVGTPGGFVVTWASEHDGSFAAYGVFGQRFASDGTPVGSDFQVNTYTTGSQRVSSVAPVGTSGAFVVIWEDATRVDVWGQRFDSSATPLGAEFQVSASGRIFSPTSAAGLGSSGDFVLTWTAGEVRGQRFASDGSPKGAEFQVNSFTPGLARNPSVATAGTAGDFIVTWYDSNHDGALGQGVFAQRFASDGTQIGKEFQVNTYTTDDQRLPAVAEVGTDGGFVVAWQSDTQDGFFYGVFAQRFGPPGSVQVTAPSSTKDAWAVDSTQRIRAEHNLGSASTFDMELSRDGGSTFPETIATDVTSAANGTAVNFDWTVTDGGAAVPQSTAVRVTSATPVKSVTDDSIAIALDSDFVNVRRPRNDVSIAGGSFKIVWLHNLGYRRPFQIELSRNGGTSFTETIAASTLSQWAWRGQFFWTPSGTCSATCVVRVTALTPPNTVDDSVTFDIVP